MNKNYQKIPNKTRKFQSWRKNSAVAINDVFITFFFLIPACGNCPRSVRAVKKKKARGCELSQSSIYLFIYLFAFLFIFYF